MLLLADTGSVYRKLFITAALTLASLIGIWRCQLGPDPKVEHLASFDQLYDSLAKYDSVVIIMKDGSGIFLDTVFDGRVDSHQKLRNLPVQGWDGKISQILISGFEEGKLVYQIEKKFDGTSNETDANIYLVIPGTTLACEVRELTMIEGDSLGLPAVTVSPAVLNDKTVLWKSSDSDRVQVGPGFVKARGRGMATLIARLRSDTTRNIGISVTVTADKRIGDSLFVQPDTLRLAAEGASMRFSIRVSPSSADTGVIWKVSDPAIATVSSQGLARGLKAGSTWVRAVSKLKASVTDSSLILVSDPVAVERLRFLKNPLTLFVGGAAESLMVEISPAQANPETEFILASPGIVALQEGKVSGITAGTVSILARSRAYPIVQDTLRITVLTGNPVSSISISPKPAGIAFTGGDPVLLSASVLPGKAPKQVQWKSAAPAIATVDDSGLVRGKAPGVARIFAISAADSAKKDSVDVQVKRDMPLLDVGGDTTLSVGQTLLVRPTVKKENGKIVIFKWDLDGVAAWDDSSTTLKELSQKFDREKETELRFYVRDNQGNDTLVSKKVKAVSGPVILILSPANNSSTRATPAKVVWTVNGQPQDTLPLEPLREGANTLTRIAKDAVGTEFSASITVYFDTIPPFKPAVHGPAVVNTGMPTWTWAPGGNGSGIFRYALDAENFGPVETKDTLFSSTTNLAEGIHTLFVQERDAAGNWSPSGRFAIRVDLTPPPSPAVRVLTSPKTNVRRPKFAWASGGGAGEYQYRLDNSDLTSGTTSTSDTSYVPNADLPAGSHTLYVRESDSAGNWSKAGSGAVLIDTTGPSAPIVTVSPSSPTNNSRPTWSWSTGGGGGSGIYRFKLGDENFASGSTLGTQISFQTGSALAEGPQTLYVQEQDSAGNWSSSGIRSVILDFTPPNKPVISATTPLSPVNTLTPTWSWVSGGGTGSGNFRVKLNNSDLNTGAILVNAPALSFTAPSALAEGSNILYVQERDAAGNWSESESRTIYCLSKGFIGGQITIGSYAQPQIVLTPNSMPYVWSNNNASGGDVYFFNGATWTNTNLPAGVHPILGSNLILNPQSGLPTFSYFVDSVREGRVSTYSGTQWNSLAPLDMAFTSDNCISAGFSRSGSQLMAHYSYRDSTLHIAKYGVNIWSDAYPVLAKSFTMSVDRIFLRMDTTADIPYVQFQSGYIAGKNFWRCKGGVWEQLSNDGLLAYMSPWVPFGVNKFGEVFAIGYDLASSGKYRISVYRYNGNSWQSVGSRFVSDNDYENGYAMAFDSYGNPIVVIGESGAWNVYAYVGTTSWKKMATVTQINTSGEINLSVDKNNVVYLVGGSPVFAVKLGFDP